MRKLIKGIIEETNARRSQKQYGFLKDFRDRKCPDFDYINEPITF